MASPKAKPGCDKPYVAMLGDKVRNRHTGETGVIEARADNQAGNWYHLSTESGMSIGIWHETDLDLKPKTAPPKTKRSDDNTDA